MKFNFKQPTVFSDDNLKGNPLAVVIDADALTYEQMTQFARWNNVSETAYLLKPTIDGADYRVRIFTINGEIPFAGHPTLGSCYVWLRVYKQHDKTTITQQCEAGLVTIKRVNGRLAFMAPPIIKVTELVDEEKENIFSALGISSDDISGCKWLDNNSSWLVIELKSVDKLLSITPDYSKFKNHNIGVCATYPEGSNKELEVRAFSGPSAVEDPVTGSLNALLAQWLIPQGKLPNEYTAGQGQCVFRDGLIYVSFDGQTYWIGGDVVDCISGIVELN